ncbi:uncharacterized protein [Apostichopus japonicus]|uniref:uncharacterized protein isoform X1 n=2 Tax=Stichopus japonicus TaxID=307972 RepID=UPI003AB10AB3
MSPFRILLVIFLTQSGVVQGKLNVTLRNSFAFNADSAEHEFFTCHISETDKTGLTVTSRRVVNTRSNAANNPRPHSPTGSDGVYQIYLSNILNGAFGVFACDISRTGREMTSIQTILLRSDASILPNDRLLTKTVNNGDEGIVLRMDDLTRYQDVVLWRKDGRSAFNYGFLTLNVPQSRGRISLSDAGIYECYHNTWRNDAVQGLQRIIVRACPADHWGPPDCFGICDNCYNGGVCDDTTGDCICPVGFKGPNCLSACDPLGRFGFNCEFRCFERADFDSACRYAMFCLPDPFGCRCASGFKGLDCSADCPQGRYGANCLQTCHCNRGGCSRFTGVCTNNNGRCQTGYSGTNCQIPQRCKQGYYGSQCLLKCHCKNDAACNKNTGRCNQCAQGFILRDPNENCQECATGFYGENCEQECHCNEACHNVNGTCNGPCKTPWVYWSPTCQTGIADIQVSKVNPGATAEINCTVESPNFHMSVTARLSVTKANQGESFIGDVGNRIELSSKSIVQSYKVTNVMSGDVFSCYLANIRYTGNTLVNNGQHYRRKEADLFVLPRIARSPDFISASNTTITISWTAWNDNSDVGDPPVIGYVPYYRTNEAEDWISSDRVQANEMPTLSFTFSYLQPDTWYQFSVAAVREGPFGKGPKSPFKSARTNCTIPSLAPLNVQAAIVEMGSTNVNISWKVPDVQCSAGIKQFLLYFNDLETPNMVEKRYIDANISWYIQKGLESGKNYSFQLTLTTEGGEGPLSEKGEDAVVSVPEGSITEDEDSGEGGSDHQQDETTSSLLWLPIVFVVLLLFMVIVAVVIFKRRRNNDKVPEHASYPDLSANPPGFREEDSNGRLSESPYYNEDVTTKDSVDARGSPPTHNPSHGGLVSPPKVNIPEEYEMDCIDDTDNIYGNLERPAAIRVADFPEYVATKTKSKTDSLIHEFLILPKDVQSQCSVGAKEENKTKNRFRNMLPFDHSRVPLDMLPNDPHSDYYNACYMLDQKDQIAFIASQGPNRASTNDFWRMLWKEDISIVVMVTNLIENGKDRCAQYWPQEQGMNKTWGLITVTWTGTQTYANYLIREMTMVQDEEQRTITQYHFTTWPDMGVPSEPTALISLVRKVKVQNKGKKTPILVHCSAGVGRTGTFIALYCLMDNLKSEKYINVYEFVEKMRKNRVNMVQTPVQYQFLCEALVEVYLTNHTEMPSGLLQNFDLTSKRDVLIEEFQLLNKLCANINLVCSVGQAPENASKNRFPDICPPDQNRPFVSSDRNFGENDYINATFVNTCAKKDAIIIAQSPLPNTIEAFWRLVCDWRVPLIVMLNKLDRKDATCPCYWPRRGGSQSYGSVTVTVIAEENKIAYVHRQFEISVAGRQKTCSVDQFQLLSWPDHGVVTGVVELLEVTKLTLDKYETEPAIIHCIDGVGRSGAVVTVLSEIERVRRDGKVDIFQTARQLRSSNSLIMAEQEHYLACYQILQAFLENAPEYGNI